MTIKDKEGNELFITNHAVFLNLKSSNKPLGRRLGTLAQDTLYTYRNKALHLHRISNSYGFNLKLLQLPRIKTIVLNVDNDKKYIIPKEVILDKGEILFFKQQGFEKQIFIKLSILEDYKK